MLEQGTPSEERNLNKCNHMSFVRYCRSWQKELSLRSQSELQEGFSGLGGTPSPAQVAHQLLCGRMKIREAGCLDQKHLEELGR